MYHIGHPILNEAGQPIMDAVNTLILAIAKHFIGDPSKYRDNIQLWQILDAIGCIFV